MTRIVVIGLLFVCLTQATARKRWTEERKPLPVYVVSAYRSEYQNRFSDLVKKGWLSFPAPIAAGTIIKAHPIDLEVKSVPTGGVVLQETRSKDKSPVFKEVFQHEIDQNFLVAESGDQLHVFHKRDLKEDGYNEEQMLFDWCGDYDAIYSGYAFDQKVPYAKLNRMEALLGSREPFREKHELNLILGSVGDERIGVVTGPELMSYPFVQTPLWGMINVTFDQDARFHFARELATDGKMTLH